MPVQIQHCTYAAWNLNTFINILDQENLRYLSLVLSFFYSIYRLLKGGIFIISTRFILYLCHRHL